MKKFTSRLQVILLWLCICIAMVESNAQSVQGVVLDEQNSPLASASIIALSSADSVMGGFALTDVQGRFRIENLKEGAFTLQVSFLGYLDSYSDINVIKGESKRIPDIVLKEGQMKLDEVVITADHVPLKMKNDTLQYNADAFNVKAHEAVEDLLKRLPGVEVAKDGSIKAQGEDVGKVLVEGKEFFGNDPTIATRNLPADAVDKVEVFDKKSEMAEFSGIDDGMEQKTINLSLKEDKKKGFFGNGKGGYGTEDRFDAKFNVNSFKGDATWTAIGTANNINAQGFSIMDYIDFMGGLGAMGGSGGRIELNSNDVGIALGQNMDQGFMNTISGGVNYNYDLSGNSDLSASYFYTRLDNDIDKTTFRQNILNEDTYETDENSVQNMLNSGHTLNLKYKQKRDSSYRLTIGGRLIYGDGSSSVELNRVLNSVALQNQTMSSSLSDRQRINLNANGTYSARLKKKGRIFSLNGDLKSRDQDGTGLIQSYNAFFAGATSTFDTLRQRQLTLNNSLDYSIRASFTEPLGRGRYLEFNLNHQNVNNDYRKDFFDLVRMGSEDGVFNQFLSDRFDRQFLYSRAGVNYKLNRKKYNLTLGLNFQYSDQKGDIGSSEVDLSRDYFSVLPVLRFDYDFHTSSSLRFNYFTNIREPSLEQLQPQVNNADPLNLYQGNPELRTEYRHQFRLNYNTFSSFSNTLFFIGLNTTYTKNKITNAQIVDENFIQTTTPVNVDYDLNTSGYLTFGFPLRPIGLKAEVGGNLVFSKGILFLNGEENKTTGWYNDYTITLQNRKKKYYDFLVGARVSHNVRKYSVSDHLDQSFFNMNYYSDLSKDFGEKWRFKTSFDYKIFPEESFGGAADLALLDASLSFNFLKHNKGQLTFSVVDIFNQNKGIDRTTALNFVQDERIISLGRYAMLSFGYSFSGFGKKNGIIIDTRERR